MKIIPVSSFEIEDLHLHTDLSFYQIHSSKLPKRTPNTFLFCLESLVFSLSLQALETPLLQLTHLLCKHNF